MRVFSPNRLALIVAVGLSACATSTAATRTQEAEDRVADERAQTELQEYHRHQHRGGIAQFIAMALDTVGASDATVAQIEAVQRDLYACMAPAGAVQERLRITVADGVAAGAVDLAAVDAIIVKLDAAAAGVPECGAVALNQLHAVLSPPERAELVDKVQAHWEVWRQVNSEDEATGGGPGARLAMLTREVSLTPDQVARASAALHTALSGQRGRFDRSSVDADVEAFGTEFEKESFDARATPMLRSNRRLPSHAANRMAIFYETVTPLLTAAQRTTLAGHLREQAGPFPAVSGN